MMSQTERGHRTWRTVRGAAAAGFIVSRWLAAVCNMPALCGWLDGASALLAVLFVSAYAGSSTGPFAVLGRRGAQLLAMTCVVSLASGGLGVAAPGWFSWLAGATDVLAWAWVLWTSVGATRWLAGEVREPAAVRVIAPRYWLISALIIIVLGLQVWALFRPRPTWWPFIDYPLYSAAHGEPIRTVHHRLYGLRANAPVEFFELTADDLGVSWFVYHTQTIPQMFDRPSRVLEEFQRALDRADMPPLQFLMPVRETFALVDSELQEFAERRLVPIDSGDLTAVR